MLRICYNNTFLELAPNTSIEVEKNSPVFAIDNAFAEYSSPVTVVYCEENIQAIGTHFFEYGQKGILRLPITYYDDLTYRGNATLVINKTVVNTQNRGRGNLQGFLLTGASRFFNKLQDVKLASLTYGGARTFNFTTFNPFDSSNGYWQHFHNTWDGTYDYVVCPYRNDNWLEPELFYGKGFINFLGRGALPGSITEAFGEMPWGQPIIPLPKVKFILEEVFKFFEWKLDLSGITDTDWHKLVMLNINPVGDYVSPLSPGGATPTLDIHINKMLSPEVTCKQFVLSIFRRFGWIPTFDVQSNTCSVFSLRQIDEGELKDFSAYAGSVIETDFGDINNKSGERIFAFKNNIDSNDELTSSPESKTYNFEDVVYRREDLPIPSINYDLKNIFCYKDNCWYKIGLDETTNDRIWVIDVDNIHDYEPDNATDTYETDASTMPVFLTEYRDDAGTKYYAYLPACKIPAGKQWGIRLLFYHGLVNELQADGTAGSLQYPFASCINVLPESTSAVPVTGTTWSNVYKHEINGVDVGIISYWFKNFITISGVVSTRLQNLYLPLHELIALKWNDRLLIKNELFILEKYVEPIPYKGYIQATLRQLLLGKTDTVITPGSEIYVQLVNDDLTTGLSQSLPDTIWGGSSEWTNATRVRTAVKFFSDAAGTVPLSVTDLVVKYRYKRWVDGSLIGNDVFSGTPFTGTETVALGYLTYYFIEYDYTPSSSPFDTPAGHYLQEITIEPDAAYNIIP